MTDEKKTTEYKDLTPKGKELNDILLGLSEHYWLEAKKEIREALDKIQITKKEIKDVADSISTGNAFIYDTLCKDFLYTDYAEDELYDLSQQPDDWIVGTEKPNSLYEEVEDEKKK